MTDPVSSLSSPSSSSSSGLLWPFSETKGTINVKLLLRLLKDHTSKAYVGVEVAFQSFSTLALITGGLLHAPAV